MVPVAVSDMNLALQKRHEQLERWRQNEANAELLEKQQRALDASNNKNRSALRSPTVHSVNRRTRNNNSNNNNNRSISFNQNSGSFDGNINDHDTRQSISSPTSSSNKNSITTSSRLNKHNKSINSFDSASLDENYLSSSSKVKFTNSTLFLNACANGDLDECKRMIEAKVVDINVTTCDGLTGLHEAAICGNCEMVEYLLQQGANINCCDNEGWTPLHAAASLGQTKIVELLLSHQADVTIVNCENFLAYDLARTDEVRELMHEHLKDYDIDQLRRQEELLIERDIERWIKTGHYEERSHPITQATVLHVLAAKGYAELMKRILETPVLKKQVDLEAKDSEGFTPLLAASFWNQTEIVELLIEHGANIFAQANSGYKISSIVSIKPFFDESYLKKMSSQGCRDEIGESYMRLICRCGVISELGNVLTCCQTRKISIY